MMTFRSGRGAAFFVLAFICLAAFILMYWAARTDSAIDDELAHIPAGYGYVHNLDYRLNPEHPPLVKALAMLPVLALNPEFPTDSPAWKSAVNGQWDMGTLFLYRSGNDADAIVRTARIMPIILTLLLVVLVYLLARRLMGAWWALLPAFLVAFDPTVLAHGHYVTTDVGAAFGVTLATFAFLIFIEAPSRKRLVIAGLAFGVAEITKFSAVLLGPLFIFLMLVLWLRELLLQWHETPSRLRTFAAKLGRRLGELLLVFMIGYAFVVYPVYALFTVNYPPAKQVSDTTQVLTSFAGGPTPTSALCRGTRCLADLDIWMARTAVLRPAAQYLLGVLMVIQRASGGNTIYFMGNVRGSGGSLYFPTLFALKEPIPALIIVLLALWLAARAFWKKAAAARFRVRSHVLDYIGVNFSEFTMASFIALYWGYSMRSPLNIGIRHLMPTIPFIYILAVGVWKKWIVRVPALPKGTDLSAVMNATGMLVRSFAASLAKYAFLVILVFAFALETLSAAPCFLSYFNEFGGGVMNGYRIVTDSNYDWGQDLLRLKAWIADRNAQCALIETTVPCAVDKIAVDYFGGGNVRYALGSRGVAWSSAQGNPADQGIHWLAISINQLQGATEPLAAGQTRAPQDSYGWLTALRPPAPGMGNAPPPDFRAGTSLFIYHL